MEDGVNGTKDGDDEKAEEGARDGDSREGGRETSVDDDPWEEEDGELQDTNLEGGEGSQSRMRWGSPSPLQRKAVTSAEQQGSCSQVHPILETST